MPKRSRSGLVSRPARVVAPTSVNLARSILTKRARHDLRKRGLAEPGRADEQHMVERLTPLARGLDEHREIGARLRLPNEFVELLRTQRGFRRIVLAALGRDEAAGRRAHFASSLSPSRMSCDTSASWPTLRAAAAIAAAACGWP